MKAWSMHVFIINPFGSQILSISFTLLAQRYTNNLKLCFWSNYILDHRMQRQALPLSIKEFHRFYQQLIEREH